MKTEDLKALGLTDEQVQRVFAMNGEEMNGLKANVDTLKAERDAARTQLADANKKLEGYDPEWKTKADQARQQGRAAGRRDESWVCCHQRSVQPEIYQRQRKKGISG